VIHQSVLDVWHEFSEPFEGRVYWMYCDTFALVTCAVGVLIDSPSAAVRLPWVLSDGSPATASEIVNEWNRVKAIGRAARSRGVALHYRQYRGPLRLTDDAIDRLVMSRLQLNARELTLQLPGFPTWPADAQLGALSRAWAAGSSLAKWPAHKAACERRDWITAGRESVLRDGLDTPQRSDDNPGVVPRNSAQLVAFRNAAIVDARTDGALRRDECYWPLELVA
jgi:hypothetical protein